MADFVTNLRQKSRDCFLAVQYAAFPDDRPSPLFPFFGALANATPLVWGCAMIPTATCQHRYKSWALAGMVNFLVNMIFGILTVFVIRRQIKEGIRMRVTTFRLFSRSIAIDVFAAYVTWEGLWVAIAAARSAEKANDTCRRHLLAQLSFTVVYIVIGSLLFVFTFATELGRLPRWRAYAALQHHRHHHTSPTTTHTRRRGGSRDHRRAREGGDEELAQVGAAPAEGRPAHARRQPRDAPPRAPLTRAQDVVVMGGGDYSSGSEVDGEVRSTRAGRHGYTEVADDQEGEDEVSYDGVVARAGTPRRVRFAH